MLLELCVCVCDAVPLVDFDEVVEAVTLADVVGEPQEPSIPTFKRPMSIRPYVDKGFAGATSMWRRGSPAPLQKRP